MLCASWFKNMATGIDWTGRRAQATRARTTTDVQIGLPRPTDFATVQCFVQLPPLMFGFSQSADRSIILAKKMETFRADFEKFQEMCETWIIENVNWSQTRLGVLPSSLWRVFLKFFFQMNRKPMRKNSYWASVHRAFSQRREKQGCFFGYFFVWVPIFDPTLVQYFIQIPHIIFCCPFSAYDKWWFEQKKSPHFREKCLVLSYLNAKSYCK